MEDVVFIIMKSPEFYNKLLNDHFPLNISNLQSFRIVYILESLDHDIMESNKKDIVILPMKTLEGYCYSHVKD